MYTSRQDGGGRRRTPAPSRNVKTARRSDDLPGEGEGGRRRRKGYSGDPEVGYPLDNVVTLLEVGLAQLVILLLDLEYLVAGLLVQAIDLILTAVDFLEGLLDLDVVVPGVSLARARILQLLGLLV